jgi:hypothetical protein
MAKKNTTTVDLEALAKLLRDLEQPCPSCRWQDCAWTVQSTDGDLMRADYRDRAARVLDLMELTHA